MEGSSKALMLLFSHAGTAALPALTRAGEERCSFQSVAWGPGANCCVSAGCAASPSAQPGRGVARELISRARILTLITPTPGVPGSGGVCPKITAWQRQGPVPVGIPGNGST